MVRTTFAQPVNVEELRGRVNALGIGEASIQEFGGPRTYQIRLPKPEGGDAAASQAVTQVRKTIIQSYPGARVDAGESVSGKVSEELARDGALAIVLAMIGIALYIWFRFEWQFGVGALVTLFHDVAMTLGFFALTQLQVDLNVVAAILTIVGYSLNDTVVVYDRIRENLRKYRKMADHPAPQPVAERDAVADDRDVAVDPAGAGRAADPRPRGHLRPDHCHLHRHFRRHLFVDLHFLADPGLAGGQARQLPEGRGQHRSKAAGNLNPPFSLHWPCKALGLPPTPR